MSGTLPGTKDIIVSKMGKVLDLCELVRAPELVSAEASDLMGSSGYEIALQHCPNLVKSPLTHTKIPKRIDIGAKMPIH